MEVSGQLNVLAALPAEKDRQVHTEQESESVPRCVVQKKILLRTRVKPRLVRLASSLVTVSTILCYKFVCDFTAFGANCLSILHK